MEFTNINVRLIISFTFSECKTESDNECKTESDSLYLGCEALSCDKSPFHLHPFHDTVAGNK